MQEENKMEMNTKELTVISVAVILVYLSIILAGAFGLCFIAGNFTPAFFLEMIILCELVASLMIIILALVVITVIVITY